MRKMAGIVLAGAMVFVVSGCMKPPKHQVWVKSGVDVKMGQAVKDLKSCSDQSGFIFDMKDKGGPSALSSEVTYEGSQFDLCMKAKGFKMK